jgi:hypothetical protein
MMKRATTWVLTAIGRRKWGMATVLMPAVVDNLGPVRAIVWAVRNLRQYERTIADLGGVRAHLMFTMASMINGCAYCTYANGRAFELHYFAEHGKLFPLDEQEFVSVSALPDADAAGRLEAALEEAGLGGEVATYRRIYALKLEGAEPRPDDRYLLHAIQFFDVLNTCAIESRAALDDAHDRINKDEALKRRYAEARLRERAAREP